MISAIENTEYWDDDIACALKQIGCCSAQEFTSFAPEIVPIAGVEISMTLVPTLLTEFFFSCDEFLELEQKRFLLPYIEENFDKDGEQDDDQDDDNFHDQNCEREEGDYSEEEERDDDGGPARPRHRK